MTDWNDGYISDIEYGPGFYAEQTPAHLDVVCLLRGIEPPVVNGDGFAYCELGCGVGQTALVVAAANPEADVWGFDFNPAHIARARVLARKGDVANIRFEEASFEQLAAGKQAELPLFDYITLHGVWSWVSLENRRFIVEFIDHYLKPGGLVYVSYNAQPGWTDAAPLQRLLRMGAGLSQARSDRRVLQALDLATAFSNAGAISLPPEMLERLGKQKTEDAVAYLSHEYLNEHWSPCYHADVAADMAGAKLNYVGTANLLENFPALMLRPEQLALLADLPPAIAETARDYFLPRTFRRDVFIRGARAIPPRKVEQRVAEAELQLVIPPHVLSREVTIPLGTATLNAPFYEPAFEALAKGSRSIAELRASAGGQANAEPREILGMLVGSRQAKTKVRQPSDAARQSVRRFNKALLADNADLGRDISPLAAVGLGTALNLRLVEMLVYEVIVDGTPEEEPAVNRAVRALLEQRGALLNFEDQPDGEAAHDKMLRDNIVQALTHGLPMWKAVGAI